MFVIWLALQLVGFSLCNGALVFTKKPDSPKYVIEGNDAVFEWDYSSDNKTAEFLSLNWSVLNKTTGYQFLIAEDAKGNVVPHPNMPPAYVGRVEKKGRATLVIKSITFEDSTTFKCTLNGKSGLPKVSEVELSVTGKASVQSKIVSGEEGGSVTCTCIAARVPGLNFKWRKQGQAEEISTGPKYSLGSVLGSSQLTIKNISKGDREYYVCDAADNNQSNSATCFVEVTHFSEDKDVKRFYFASIDAELTFSCPVSGYPPPIVTWAKNDTQLQKGLNPKFTINPVKEDDFGNYTCTATNGRASLGPFTIRVVNRIDELRTAEAMPAEALKLEWSPHAGAKYYVVEISGTDIHADVVCGNKTSLELHYNQFAFKNPGNKPDEIDVCANVKAIGDEEVEAKTSVCQKFTIKSNNQVQRSNSVRVTVPPSVMCLLLLLSVNWKIWY